MANCKNHKNFGNRNNGFGAVEVILLLAIVALLGFVGYRVWQSKQAPQANQTPTPMVSRDSPSVTVPPISNVTGLDSVLQTLDSTGFDATAEGQLNGQLSF